MSYIIMDDFCVIDDCAIDDCAIDDCAINDCAINDCAIDDCAIDDCAIDDCAINDFDVEIMATSVVDTPSTSLLTVGRHDNGGIGGIAGRDPQIPPREVLVYTHYKEQLNATVKKDEELREFKELTRAQLFKNDAIITALINTNIAKDKLINTLTHQLVDRDQDNNAISCCSNLWQFVQYILAQCL